MEEATSKKVLICCPIGDGKEYSINEWFAYIARQTYDNFDVAVCVNGKSEESIKYKRSLLEQVEINNKKLIVLELAYNQYHTTKHRLSYAREELRKYAIDHDYDFVFWLDSDTIPQLDDALQLLINTEKKCISGLYFYKNTRQSVIIDNDTQANMSYEKITSLVESGDIVKVWGFGFGCLLMHKDVFSSVAFDYKHKYENWSEDFIYCDLLDEKHIDRYFYARIVCKHYHPKDFTIHDTLLCNSNK